MNSMQPQLAVLHVHFMYERATEGVKAEAEEPIAQEMSVVPDIADAIDGLAFDQENKRLKRCMQTWNDIQKPGFRINYHLNDPRE